MVNIQKVLYKDNVGDIPINSKGQEVPALLFSNSKDSTKLGDLYLFDNFGIAGGNTINASSDITTHYVEDNSSIQDHWALAPVTYNLTGFIGEVIYQPPSKMTNWVQNKVTNYLEPLTIISPTVSSYVNSAMNVVHQIETNYQKYSQYAENIVKSFNAMQGITTQPSNQYNVYQQLKKLRDERILVEIYTPYGILKNMAIINITMTQDENTKYKSSIQVQLQEYRKVSTIVRQATQPEVATLVASQKQAEVNTGQAKGKDVNPNDSALLTRIKQGKDIFQ